MAQMYRAIPEMADKEAIPSNTYHRVRDRRPSRFDPAVVTGGAFTRAFIRGLTDARKFNAAADPEFDRIDSIYSAIRLLDNQGRQTRRT
jgi:hypothetical protein